MPLRVRVRVRVAGLRALEVPIEAWVRASTATQMRAHVPTRARWLEPEDCSSAALSREPSIAASQGPLPFQETRQVHAPFAARPAGLSPSWDGASPTLAPDPGRALPCRSGPARRRSVVRSRALRAPEPTPGLATRPLASGCCRHVQQEGDRAAPARHGPATGHQWLPPPRELQPIAACGNGHEVAVKVPGRRP